MAEKKLKLSLDIDDRAFISAIKRMQDQLSQIQTGPNLLRQQQEISRKMQAMGMGPLPGLPSDKELQQAQRKAQEVTSKIFDETRRKMEIIKRLQTDLNREQEKGNLTEERKLKIQERLADLKKAELRSTGELTGLMGRPSVGGGGGLGGLTKMFLGGATVLVFGEIFNKVTGAIQKLINAPTQIAAAQGSAIGGLAGTDLSQMRSGEFIFQSMFPGERQAAMGMAQSQGRRQRTLDMFNPAKWMDILSGMEGANISQQITENFRSAFGGLVQQNPYLKNATDLLRENMGGFLSTQRMLGIGDKGLFGYLQGLTNAGFRPELGMQASQQIIGAGGSTQMGLNALTALQFQRGLGITNAPQLLGGLSGTLGGAGASRDALADIISRGLDRSQFAEENRKFAEGVVDLANKAGVASKEAVGDLAQMMKDFLTGTTTQRGIEAGARAFQTISQMGAATSGYQGAINLATLMKVPGMEKIKDPYLLQSLANMQLGEISPERQGIQQAALQMGSGMTAQRLTNILRNQKFEAVRTMVQRPEQFERAVQFVETMLKSTGGKIDLTKLNLGAEGGTISAALQVQGGMRPLEAERATAGLVTQKAIEDLMQDPKNKYMRQQLEEMHKKSLDQTEDALESKNTGRKIDELLTTSADQASVAIKDLASSIDQLTASAKTAGEKMVSSTSAGREAASLLHNMGLPGFWSSHTDTALSASVAKHFAEIIQQNVSAGRDVYYGMSSSQISTYERAKKQVQGTP